ncbi:MAG: MFS transporter [Proteobacteria bacterium]|nr:MFS transporter [Pseudomonadota bacterium]
MTIAPPPSNLRRAAPIVAGLCSVYILAHFYRVSTGVIAPDIMAETGIGAEAMGGLSGAFFFAFALFQIPVGILLDRFGPRLVVPLLLIFAVVGALVFAVSDSALGLTIGRALMGMGTASILMGSLVVATRWFPPDRFAAVASFFVAMGTLGALMATTPLAAVSEAAGWRGAFFIMAGVTLLFGVVAFLVVRDAPPGHAYYTRKHESLRQVARGLGEVLRNPQLKFIVSINSVAYAAVLAITALWGGPYLAQVYGLEPVARGNVLLLMTVGQVLGHLTYGRLDRILDTRKGLIVFGATASIAILLILALSPALPLWGVTTMFVAFGFISGYSVIITTHGRAIFPERLVGRGMTTNNTSVFLGAAIVQWATGAIIGAFVTDAGETPEVAYRVMFGFLAALQIAALVFYSRAQDAKPSEDLARQRAD